METLYLQSCIAELIIELAYLELVQDLLKLEAIQAELIEYNGGQPTFSQWATAAGVDEKTLRKRLNYGIYCKNRMVTSNVRLVISIAREFEGPGMDFYDLIQVIQSNSFFLEKWFVLCRI